MRHVWTSKVTTHAHVRPVLPHRGRTALMLMNVLQEHTTVIPPLLVKTMMEVLTVYVELDLLELDQIVLMSTNAVTAHTIAAPIQLVQTRTDHTGALASLASLAMDSTAQMLMSVVCYAVPILGNVNLKMFKVPVQVNIQVNLY